MASANLSSCLFDLTRVYSRRNKNRPIAKNLVFEIQFVCTTDAVSALTTCSDGSIVWRPTVGRESRVSRPAPNSRDPVHGQSTG